MVGSAVMPVVMASNKKAIPIRSNRPVAATDAWVTWRDVIRMCYGDPPHSRQKLWIAVKLTQPLIIPHADRNATRRPSPPLPL